MEAASGDVDRYAPLFDGDRELARLWVAEWMHDDPPAREQLAIIYAPLVRYVVSRMNVTLPPSLERGDLVGMGMIGLIDAIGRFDLDRGLTFQTYGVMRIRGAILDGLRSADVRSTMLAYQNGYLVSLEDRMASDPFDDDSRHRDLVDPTTELPDEMYDHRESQLQLRERIRGLRQRDRVVIALYYFEELTFTEIGRVLGVSESRARQVHGRAIRALRDAG